MDWREALEKYKSSPPGLLLQWQIDIWQKRANAVKNTLEKAEKYLQENSAQQKPIIDQPSQPPAQPAPIPKTSYQTKQNEYPTQNYNPTNNPFDAIKWPQILPNLEKNAGSKLPKEADGQTPFKTPAGNSIDLQKDVSQRTFGGILWNPLIDSSIKIVDVPLDDVPQRFNDATKKGIELLINALFSENHNTWDKAAFIMPDNLVGFNGNINLQIGLMYLKVLALIYRKDSERALIEVNDYISTSFDVQIEYLPPHDPNFKEFIGNESDENLDSDAINFDIAALDSLDDIRKVLNPDAFPGNFAPLFNQDRTEYESAKAEEEKLLNWDSESLTYQVSSYPELMLYFVQELDALIGEFPSKIEIEDADLTKEGDQKKTIYIGNIAEGITELYGLLISNSLQTDVSTNVLLRLIPEIIRLRQIGLTTQDVVVANRDFLGYKSKEVQRDVKSNFTTIPETNNIADIGDFSKLLSTHIDKYKTEEFDQNETLMDYLLRLMYLAGILKKVHLKTPEDVDEMFNKEKEIIDENALDWDEFQYEINNPDGRFNVGNKPSKLYGLDTTIGIINDTIILDKKPEPSNEDDLK